MSIYPDQTELTAPSTDDFNSLVELLNEILLTGTLEITVSYTNHRGVKSIRKLDPVRVWFGATKWHSEPCLLLNALDVEKDRFRDFKITDFDMHTLELTDAVFELRKNSNE